MSSPEYSTTNVVGPAVKLPTSTTAIPSITSPEYCLPPILTVTLPVAFSGRVTVIVPFSPETISPTVMLIGESYLGAVMSVVLTVELYLSSPEYITSTS